MNTDDLNRPVFSYIQQGHPFYPLIERLREAISLSRYSSLMAQVSENEKTIICADLSQSSVPGSGWNLKQFYWSFQYRDERDSSKFSAVTFYYSSKEEHIVHSCQFPSDPFLESVERFFLKRSIFGMNDSRKDKVLQYTPFRRLAVSIDGESSGKTSLVCKFKKRSRYQLAYEKLVHVFEAGRQSHLSFSLAAPIKIDHENGVFFQELKRGEDLSKLMTELNFIKLMETLGSLHYDLHQLRVSEMPKFDFSTFLDELKTNISWIIFFNPEQEAMLNNVKKLLLENPPDLDPAAFRFCHGDFVCSQILIDGDQWSVIDFDLAMQADPYLEIGRLLASLKYDIPFFSAKVSESGQTQSSCLNEAIESYLRAYEKRSDKKLSRKHLLWYQMWYEVFYLSLMFKKDRFDLSRFTYASHTLIELSLKLLNTQNNEIKA